ncbi:unnamed protein product [Miscanthus lutarioriparius]|uniref:Peptidase A1 domain-containing protein n=1 Tax=Miscanthus lutarioriparius TaxID=422564 RepID=A0A811RT88_9POAL|nr:unnamed protein product [Miscanthus lutarioriparius]
MTTNHIVIILASFMIFFLVVPALPADAESRGFRGTMIRRARTDTTAINFTQAAQESHRRLSFLAARSQVDKQSSASHLDSNSNTETELTALADTGSDLIWTKCGAGAAWGSSSPSYHPDKSSSFTKLPCSHRLCTALRSVARCAAGGAECDYTYSYGLGGGGDRPQYTPGFLGSETFTLGGEAVPGVGFGCTTASEGNYGTGSGLVGLGRGPLSLVSQLHVGTFMYCLTRDASKASPLLFGSLATMTGAGVQSTGLLGSTIFYAVNLRSITIGSATTAGVGGPNGVVFDSGTTLTYLAEPAYTEAKAAFLSQTNLTQVEDWDGFEACYRKPSNGRLLSSAVPAMVLHFDGGADMALPVANYVMEKPFSMQSITTGFQRTDHDAFSLLILKWVSLVDARLDRENVYHSRLSYVLRWFMEMFFLHFRPFFTNSIYHGGVCLACLVA